LEISGFEILTTVAQNNTFLWCVTNSSLKKLATFWRDFLLPLL